MAKAEVATTSVVKTKAPLAVHSSVVRDKLADLVSREFVFAVVGYAGSGTSFVAEKLEAGLRKQGFNVHIIKAREVLDDFAKRLKRVTPSGLDRIDLVAWYQELGDELRNSSSEYGAVAAYLIKKIHKIREANPDKTNVFVLDSIKHPAEVELLRHVYGEAFCLVGVGCRPDVREPRLKRKFHITETGDASKLSAFISRDAEDSVHKYGQRVNDTFHLSDYFVDNTGEDTDPKKFTLPEQINRLIEILFTAKVHRPKRDERGLYFAHAAAMRSSCLSRQVGASILDSDGNLLSVGTNEVPKAGGGLYNEDLKPDHRCFHDKKCWNSEEQEKILKDVYEKLLHAEYLTRGTTFDDVRAVVKRTRIKSLLEFSRSVHAEMEAILSMVRVGVKMPPKATLYSTTYPCHNCARHIVAAGIDQVVYLEPYTKSLAIGLHKDAIADNESDENSQGRVRFTPYQGVSPRLYEIVYLKTTDLKDEFGAMIKEDEIKKVRVTLWTKSYKDLEKDVIEYIENQLQLNEQPDVRKN